MTGKPRIWLAVLVLTLGLVPAAGAFPPFPPYQCPWHEAKECPCTHYSCCHYFVPALYRWRAYHTPPRYMYGFPDEMDTTFVGYRVDRYPCMSASSAAQSAIYTDTDRREGAPENGTAEKAPQGPGVQLEPKPQPPRHPAY